MAGRRSRGRHRPRRSEGRQPIHFLKVLEKAETVSKPTAREMVSTFSSATAAALRRMAALWEAERNLNAARSLRQRAESLDPD